MKPDPSHAGATYRPEIDGLRALAVLPVILFHAGFEAFRGGYLGVDVFFVISGYLITTIILGDHAAGRFTIASFYERRARRILPALFVVVAACIPFAVAWMLPVELRHFSRSVLAVLAFIPNVYFWMTTSYFGTAAEEVPLLHTWSLGVEEQFYVFFPLMVAAAWRFGLGAVAASAAVIGLASFGLAEWAWRSGKTSAAFFLVPTRTWELMIGALLAMANARRPLLQCVHPRTAKWLSAAGLAALVASIATFDESTPMPSYYGLIPTVGTALAIGFTARGTWTYRLLAQPWLVGVGLVSYSAYLWHQPLFAFARLLLAGPVPVGVLAALIGLTFLLAYLTWRYVESPFRQRRVVGTAMLVKASVAGAMGLAVLGLAGDLTRGLEGRLLPESRSLASMADTKAQGVYVAAAFLARDSDFTSRQATRILVIGDSYAQDFVNMTLEAGLGDAIEIRTSYIASDCQIYFGPSEVQDHIEPRFRPKCDQQRVAAARRDRIDKADLVVLAGSWRPWAVDRLSETIAGLRLGAHQQLAVVGIKHFGAIRIRQLLRLEATGYRTYRQAPQPGIATLNASLASAAGPTNFVDTMGAVCDSPESCPVFTPSGALISFDGTHLTPDGARHVGTRIWSQPPLAAWAARRSIGTTTATAR